jgi:hypothetical protein
VSFFFFFFFRNNLGNSYQTINNIKQEAIIIKLILVGLGSYATAYLFLVSMGFYSYCGANMFFTTAKISNYAKYI